MPNGNDEQNNGTPTQQPEAAQADTVFETSSGLKLPTPSPQNQYRTASGKELPVPEADQDSFETSSGQKLPVPGNNEDEVQTSSGASLPKPKSDAKGSEQPDKLAPRYRLRLEHRKKNLMKQIDSQSINAGRARRRAEEDMVPAEGVSGTMYIPNPEKKEEEQRFRDKRDQAKKQLQKMDEIYRNFGIPVDEEATPEDKEFDQKFRNKLIESLEKREEELRTQIAEASGTKTKVNPRTGMTYEVDEELPEEAQMLEEEADKLRGRRMELLEDKEAESKEGTTFLGRSGDQFQKSWLNFKNSINNISNYSSANRLEMFNRIDSGDVSKTLIESVPTFKNYADADPEEKEQMKDDLLTQMSENTSQIIENRNKADELYENPMTKAMVESDSFEEGFDAFMRNPIDAITGLSAESSLQMVPGIALGALGASTGNPALASGGFMVGSGGVEFGASLGEGVLDEAAKEERTNQYLNEKLSDKGVLDEGEDGMQQFKNLKIYQEDVVSSLPDMPQDVKESIFDDLRSKGLVAESEVDGQQVERFAGKPRKLLETIGENEEARKYLSENLPSSKYGNIDPANVKDNLDKAEQINQTISESLKEGDNILHDKVMNVLQDDEAMSDIGQRAAIRGGVIGVAEGLSATIPGAAIAKQIGRSRAISRALGQTTKMSLSDKARVGGSLAMGVTGDAVGGGAGEALAMAATGEEIQAGEVLAEAAPELISGPFDIGSVAKGLSSNNLTKAEREVAEQIKKQREQLNVPFRSPVNPPTSETQEQAETQSETEQETQPETEEVADEETPTGEPESTPEQQEEEETTADETEALGQPVEEENVVGEPQFFNGLAIASQQADGTTFVGGTTHADLIERHQDQMDMGNLSQGFYTPDGRFLSRNEAAQFRQAEEPDTQQEEQAEPEPTVPEEEIQEAQKISSLDDETRQAMERADLPDAAIEQAETPDIVANEEGQPAQTGQPIRVEVFQGRGREQQESIYTAGAEGPVLGEANYYALNENEAQEFGPEVEQSEVTLENPLVIDSDQELARWLMGDENAAIPTTNERRNQHLPEFRNRVEEAGHDGVIVNIPRMADVNQQGQSVKRTQEIFGKSQVVKFPASQQQQQQRQQTDLLFAEDLSDVSTVEIPVMDGRYRVRRDQSGITVTNTQNGQTIGRESNNFNQAVAEAIIRDVENNSNFVDESELTTEEQWFQAVAENSNNPLEIAQAYHLATQFEQEQRESSAQGTLQNFFEEGGRIRPQDFAEHNDPNRLTDNNRLRFYTNTEAQPIDIQAQELSSIAGVEITPEMITDFLVDDFIQQERQVDQVSETLRERFQDLTGVNLTDQLANEILSQELDQFADQEGNILQEVDTLIEDYVDEEGNIDYQRLWDEKLSEDQDKDFFTSFPGALSETEYEQLKEEVQNEIGRDDTGQAEEAAGPVEVDEEGAEQGDVAEEQVEQPEQQPESEPEPQQPTVEPSSAEYGSQNQIVSRDRAEEARQRLREKLGGQFNAGIDPSAMREMMELAMFHLEAGSRKFADFAEAMINDVGEKIKPYLRTIYKQAKYRGDIPRDEFSSDVEIIEWEEENLSENNLINSIDRDFRDRVAEQEAQGYKTMGRPELANPVNDEQGREAVDYVDQQREDEGTPSPRSDREVTRRAQERLDQDYEGEKARLFDMARNEQNPGMWTDVDVKMAKIIMGRESQQALSSNNRADLFNFFLMTSIYRQVGTEQARAFRQRQDETKSPKQRRAEFVKEVFTASKQSVDVVVEIHRLAEQAMNDEITKQEFRDQVRELLDGYRSQREQQVGGVKKSLQKLIGKRLRDSEIDDIYDAAQEGGEQAIQESINEKAGKLNIPKMSIAQLMQLESHIENVESAPRGELRNRALLDLMEFLEDSDIVGGRFSQTLRAAVDDILNREQNMFDDIEDILDSVRNRVMENITQALLTPPKNVQQRMDEAETQEEREEIFNNYMEEFEKIKESLKDEVGVDIENLTEEDIQDPILMNDILRRFQAANSNFGSKMYEFWNNAILSALTTHAVNIAGTSANLFFKSVPIRIGEAVANTLGGDPQQAQWGELKYFWKGFFTHIPEAIRYSWLAFQTETRLFAEEIGAQEGVKKFQERKESGAAIKGKWGRLVRMMGWRPLTAMDEFHKVIAFRMQLSALAYREAKFQGLEGEEITRFIEHQQRNPSGKLSEQAWGFALEVAFQERPGKLTGAFKDVRETIPLAEYAFPFVQTPGNLIKQGTRKGPFGMLNIIARSGMHVTYRMGLNDNNEWVYNQEEVTKHAAEQFVFWTAFAGIGMALASAGEDEDDPRPLITGSGASFRDQSEYRFEQQNYPAQSIRLPGTDRYYSYKRFDPFATIITQTVDAVNAVAAADKGQEMTDVMNDYWEKNLRLISDKSYFQFIGDFVRFTQYPASGLDWIANFTASWMPNIIRHGVRHQDEYVREWSRGDPEAKSLAEVGETVIQKTAQKAWPAASNQPKPRVDWLGLPVKKDALGGAKQTYLYRMFSPSQTIENPPSDYDRLLMNWNNQNPNDQWHPGIPSDRMTINGKDVKLEGDTYFEYANRRGFHTRRLLDEQYRKFDFEYPREDDIKRFRSAQRKAGRIAKENMIDEGIIVPPLPDE